MGLHSPPMRGLILRRERLPACCRHHARWGEARFAHLGRRQLRAACAAWQIFVGLLSEVWSSTNSCSMLSNSCSKLPRSDLAWRSALTLSPLQFRSTSPASLVRSSVVAFPGAQIGLQLPACSQTSSFHRLVIWLPGAVPDHSCRRRAEGERVAPGRRLGVLAE